MENDRNRPAIVMPTNGNRTSQSDASKASEGLAARIAEVRRRNDMPLDSALGNPSWEKNAADGRLDALDRDDE